MFVQHGRTLPVSPMRAQNEQHRSSFFVLSTSLTSDLPVHDISPRTRLHTLPDNYCYMVCSRGQGTRQSWRSLGAMHTSLC